MIETAEFVFWASGATVFCFILAASMVRVMDRAVARARREKVLATTPTARATIALRDGIERDLSLDLGALCAIEKLSGKSLMDLMEAPGIGTMRDILFVAQDLAGGTLTPDGVAALMDYDKFTEYMDVVGGMLLELQKA